MRQPTAIKLLKPNLRGRWTKNGVQWTCAIRQQIGEMRFVVSRSRRRYRPGLAYKEAISGLRTHSGYADAVRLLGARK